jgi:hypothetical protein
MWFAGKNEWFSAEFIQNNILVMEVSISIQYKVCTII